MENSTEVPQNNNNNNKNKNKKIELPYEPAVPGYISKRMEINILSVFCTPISLQHYSQ